MTSRAPVLRVTRREQLFEKSHCCLDRGSGCHCDQMLVETVCAVGESLKVGRRHGHANVLLGTYCLCSSKTSFKFDRADRHLQACQTMNITGETGTFVAVTLQSSSGFQGFLTAGPGWATLGWLSQCAHCRSCPTVMSPANLARSKLRQ